MRIDAVPCCIGNLYSHLIELADFGVGDLVATGANQVRMRIGPAAVVPVASGGETDFEKFTDLFEQVNCFINCRQAGCGEIFLDFSIDLLNPRVILTLQKGPENGYSLRCDTEIALAQLGQDVIQSFLNIVQLPGLLIPS